MKNPIKVILLRIVNFYRGSSVPKPFGKILRKFYLKYIQKKMREDKRVVAKIDGIKYELNLNQDSELETYYGGGYEPTVAKIIKKYLKTGMTAMDVGARVGLHTLRMKKLVGQEGLVIAIEPDEKTFPLLMKNAKLNNYSITAENKALSDRNEGKEITLDAYVETMNVAKLDFIKIDTDGCEYQIIKGGLNMLKRFKPIMVIEFNRKSLENNDLEPMIDLLESLGYSFFQDRNLKEYPSKKSMLDKVVVGSVINVLCK